MAADFVLAPDFQSEETPQFKTIITQYENGVEQRRAKWATPIREFSLSYKNRSATDFCCARDFYLCKCGGLCSFTWENASDACCYTVRFKEDSLMFRLISYCIWDFSFNLIQVK
jgi:uncharacterized protein (TIGR02217 family)